MMSRYLLGTLICFGLLAPAAAHADLKYFPDPAYKRLNDDDPPPMSEMVDLANQGDPRAMFILADMSEKGKGGLMQDRKQAYHWFEESAMHDYAQSFIRLAAMAKHDKNPKAAWQWYTLAIENLDAGPAQDYATAARKDLVSAAGLTQEDIDQAHTATNEWKANRDKHLREEEDADAKKEQPPKEQPQKDSADKDAPAAKDQPDKETQVQKDLADIDRADKEQAAKEQAEKDKAAKEKADKEQATKENAAKEQADKDKADKDKDDADSDSDDNAAVAVKVKQPSKNDKTDKQENDDDEQN